MLRIILLKYHLISSEILDISHHAVITVGSQTACQLNDVRVG